MGLVSSETIVHIVEREIMAAKMEYARKNTVKVRFGDQARSPSDSDMVTFVVRGLGIKPEQVSHLYHDPYEKCIVIKFINETLMKMCLEQHIGEKVFGYSSGQGTKVMVTDGNEEVKYVRLFYIPPEVPDREVAEFMKKFGVVKKIVHEKRSMGSGFNCFSGVRGIYMDVNKEVPPQVYICNYRCRVYYSGMQEKCFICKATDHLKPDCPRRAERSLNPRERVREKEESIALNFTNLNSLVGAKEGKEGRVDNNAAGAQRGGDASTMGAADKVMERDTSRSEAVDVDAESGDASGWVNVHTKVNRNGSSIVNKGSSEGASQSGKSEKSENLVADVLIGNTFADLSEVDDENEISDVDPKKRKLSSLLSFEK